MPRCPEYYEEDEDCFRYPNMYEQEVYEPLSPLKFSPTFVFSKHSVQPGGNGLFPELKKDVYYVKEDYALQYSGSGIESAPVMKDPLDSDRFRQMLAEDDEEMAQFLRESEFKEIQKTQTLRSEETEEPEVYFQLRMEDESLTSESYGQAIFVVDDDYNLTPDDYQESKRYGVLPFEGCLDKKERYESPKRFPVGETDYDLVPLFEMDFGSTPVITKREHLEECLINKRSVLVKARLYEQLKRTPTLRGVMRTMNKYRIKNLKSEFSHYLWEDIPIVWTDLGYAEMMRDMFVSLELSFPSSRGCVVNNIDAFFYSGRLDWKSRYS